MRHRFLLLAVAGILVMAFTPGLASADKVTFTGGRIDVLVGEPTTYPADTPFFVTHGVFAGPPGQEGTGEGRHTAGELFELYVDGRWIAPSWEHKFPGGPFGDGGIVSHLWGFNFPDGLPAGPHTLVGLWYLPCAVVEGDLVAECDNPNTPVMFLEESLAVDFLS